MRSRLAILSRQAPLVAATTIITIGVALATSSARAPLHEGRVEIVVQAPAFRTRTATGLRQPPPDSSRMVANEIRLLTSQEVRALATRRLGFTPKVTADQVDQTDVIEVAARAATPQRALATARQYATAYIDFRRTRAADDLLASGREVQRKLDQLTEQIDDATGSERAALELRYDLFGDVQAQLQVDAASAQDLARLVSPASGEISTVKPGLATTGAWAALLGLGLGIDFALLFHFLDESVRTRDDLGRASGGLIVMGVIPDRRQGSAVEAYRSLRTVLLSGAREPPVRFVQVTSPGPGEGKTTTVANLGVALAEAGQRVVLVDANLHDPGLHEHFGLSNDAGLTSVALGTVPLPIALQSVPGHVRLSLLPSGPFPPGLGELLASPYVAAALASVGQVADLVLIDSPSVLTSADAILVSRLVDSTVLLAYSGRTKRRNLGRAVALLLQVGAPLSGVVLNGTTSDVGLASSAVRGRG